MIKMKGRNAEGKSISLQKNDRKQSTKRGQTQSRTDKVTAQKKETRKQENLSKSTPLHTSGIKKQYQKSSGSCKVTFVLPKEAAPDARVVTIVGDFNNWNSSETPLKKLKNGDFSVTLPLKSGREYRYRYLIDSNRWENDWHADRYVRNSFGSDDSLIIV